MTEEELRKNFSTNLAKQIEISGKLKIDIADDLGVSKQNLNNWLKGLSVPRPSVLQKIADYFGVNKYALLEDYDEYVEQGRQDYALLKRYHILNSANKSVLLSTLDALIAAQSASDQE